MPQSITYRLSVRWLVFAPAIYYLLLFLAAFLPILALAGIHTNWMPYFVICFGITVLGLLVYIVRYLQYRDSFLMIQGGGIVLLGLPIAWKYIEPKMTNGNLILYITDASAINLARIPWPFRTFSGSTGYSIVILPRNEIRLPWWIFEGSFAEVMAIFHASQPKMTPELEMEKAAIKQQGREYSFKGDVATGIALSIGFAFYAIYLISQDGMRATSSVIILFILLSAFWYAIYSFR